MAASYDYTGCYTFSTATYFSQDSVYGLGALTANGISVAACAAKCNNPVVMAMLSDASEGKSTPFTCMCYSYFDAKIFDQKVQVFGCTATCGDGNPCGASLPCSTFSESGVAKPCIGQASVYMRKGDTPAPLPPSKSSTITSSSSTSLPTSITTPPSNPNPSPTTPGSGPNPGGSALAPAGSPSSNDVSSANDVITTVQTSESTTIVDGKPVVVTISSTITFRNPAAGSAPPQKSSSLAMIIGGAAAGVAVIAFVIVVAVVWNRRSRSEKGGSNTQSDILESEAPQPDAPVEVFGEGTKSRGGHQDAPGLRESTLPPSYDSIGEVSALMTSRIEVVEKKPHVGDEHSKMVHSDETEKKNLQSK